MTDAEGRFLVTNCPGDSTLRVEVRGPGVQLAEREEVDPRAGEIMFRVEAQPERSAHILGTVVDPDGQPVRNAQISLHYSSTNLTPYPTEAGTGRFAIGPLRPGKYRLSMRAAGYPWLQLQERELLANKTLDLGMIHLERGGELQARFHYSGDGPRPQTFVRVYDDPGGGYSGFAVSDSHNEVLLPGAYRLSVTGADVATQSIPFEVRAGANTSFDVTIERGLRRDFTFVLPSGSGAVQRVFMTIEGGRDIVHQLWVSRWDRDEITSYCSLAPGSYTVTASTDEGLEGRAEFAVFSGGEDEVIRVVLR